jgi:predicted Zn-dependent protease
LFLAATLVLALSATALADRTHLKPGFNMFSPDQDIQLGKKFSSEVEHQLPMLNDPKVDNYLNQLGHRLDAHVPPGTPAYPFQYKCVNDMAINAFALPGGFIYINRGVIESADTEAQLAGVMAHETSHVVLRHSTNQVSKAYAWQAPLSILGGAVGGGSLVGVLAQMGISSGMNMLFLKYSRTDESQADILGTQILYDTNYDPRAMAQFFEKIQAESKSRPVEFFSDHPNPDHRIERVDEEVQKLGGPPSGYKSDSPEFQQIKRYVHSLPPAPKQGVAQQKASSENVQPAPPSGSYRSFQNADVQLNYPEAWSSYGQGSTLTFAPQGALVDDGQGNTALAYGVIVSVFEPRNDSSNAITLEAATDQLLDNMLHSNPKMRIAQQREPMQIGGQAGLSTFLSNDSPKGGRESDWLVTALRSNGLFYVVCVAPQNEYNSYKQAFQALVDSIRFPQ